MRTGIGSHTRAVRGQTDCWLTPPEIIEALGPFDLDPCAAPGQPWATAKHQYAPPQDGLELPWFGRVWVNPPYGQQTGCLGLRPNGDSNVLRACLGQGRRSPVSEGPAVFLPTGRNPGQGQLRWAVRLAGLWGRERPTAEKLLIEGSLLHNNREAAIERHP